jgi:phenylpropionate dioxygenase-like ring-hydroxylating dioxygenase large terminal subunit
MRTIKVADSAQGSDSHGETGRQSSDAARHSALREQLARAEQPVEEALTLPPSVYTSASVYEIEKRTIFSKEWLMVGRMEQIPNVGDFFTYDLFGHKLLIVRAAAEDVRCFSRVCLHRSALIAEGSGNCQSFVCPYHSWSYDLRGTMRSARNIAKSCFSEAQSQLPQARVEQWLGCIFINFDENAAPLAPQIPGLTAFFAPYAFQDMVLLPEYIEFDTRMNWKVLCENFMEAYHHPGPHIDMLQRPFPYTASYVLDNHNERWSVLAMPNPAEDDQNLLPGIRSLNDWRKTGLVAAIVYPNTLLAFTGDSGIWYQIIPDTVDHFTLRIRSLVPRTSLEVDSFAQIAKRIREEFLRPLHLQDEAINNSVWAGLNSIDAAQGRLHPKFELALWQMNQWWCRHVGVHLT